MQNEFWHTKWKTKETGWDQKQPSPLLIEYFKTLNLKPGARVFVPLSGKSIDMFWLANQGYQVVGIELNLDACRLFFNEHNIPYTQSKQEKFEILSSDHIKLFVGDFFDLDKTTLGNVDAVYDRAALIALPNETHHQYAHKIMSLQDIETQILLITFDYDRNQMTGPPFAVNPLEVQAIFGKNFTITTLYNEEIEILAHLKAKGLTQLQELAFHLKPIKI